MRKKLIGLSLVITVVLCLLAIFNSSQGYLLASFGGVIVVIVIDLLTDDPKFRSKGRSAQGMTSNEYEIMKNEYED